MKSIKNKIITFSVIATLIPSLALGLLSFRQNEELVSHNVTRELRALARNVSRELDLWVNENDQAIRAISVSSLIINSLSAMQHYTAANDAEKTEQVLAHFLRSVQAKLGSILELTVADATGRVIASSVSDPDIGDLSKDWLQRLQQDNWLMEGVWASSLHWNAQYQTAIFNIIVPILSYDDAFIGTIIATLNLGAFRDSMDDTLNPTPGEVVLLSQTGHVLLSSTTDIPPSMAIDEAVLQKLKAKPGELMSFTGLTQPKVIGLFDVPKMLPVTVLVERDYNEIYAAWIRLRNFFLGFVSVLIIIVAAVALYIGRSIVIPLESLIGATRHIVDGDLNVRVDVKQSDEVGQLANMFNLMTDKLQQNHEEIMAANAAMRQQNQMLEALSVTDSMTGLLNRSKLDAVLTDELARFGRNKRPFSVLMIDVDHFKTLNDNLGHIVGDEILIAVAKVLANSIRSVDFAARYGGDEFVVILTETTADAAIKTAERIRMQVAEVGNKLKEHKIAITLSIGISHSLLEDKSPTLLLARVDNALYEAKKAGRNRIHVIF
ncbi:diguanylate cyclase (GGDEF)-like protein [Nitrosomonas nitrosa]|uniref:diguanylate cyclase n=1 Tax=Nitrosomonas nitrosa TaxID=52442 RepID=A0A1I4QV92_9PROT|nr:diguanylate cyclase [Nitrosomonas nitrosa]PTR03556.1 diguanylate cyclase (GGDEF)-like protein [Nitrosomonas nitrosa]SFM43959.1 diguanylate cyclase (GGDEF) domain-containing protein [Nitrosomonas nitrosa]